MIYAKYRNAPIQLFLFQYQFWYFNSADTKYWSDTSAYLYASLELIGIIWMYYEAGIA